MNAKENLLRVIRHDHPQWVPYGMENTIVICPPIVTRPQRAGSDSWNVRWEWDAGGTYPSNEEHVITDLSAWRDQIHFPDLNACVGSQFPSGWGGEEAPVVLKDVDRDTHLLCGVIELSLFERSYLLLGMEEALMSYVTQTRLMDELLGAIADFHIELIKRFDDAADLDMIWYGDDWGTQQGLFLPPEIWRRTVGKHTRRVYNCMKQRDLIINQHSCGKIESVFADIVEMGADVWNPCQPCNDLASLKRRFAGRVTFCGGIDSQFVLDRPGVTTDEVRAEVRRRIDDLAEGGGYIAAPSHSVTYQAGVMEAMNDEIRTYGQKFYRKW